MVQRPRDLEVVRERLVGACADPLFAELEAVAGPEAILATNTSSLSVTAEITAWPM